MRYTIWIGAALALGGCSVNTDLSSGGVAVEDFHRQLDAGQFAAIEAAATPEIRATPGGFVPVLATVHAKLGAVKSSTRTASTTATTMAITGLNWSMIQSSKRPTVSRSWSIASSAASRRWPVITSSPPR